MNIWIVEVGEPLPIDEGAPRLMRAGLLCEELAAKGHDATWFTSSFNHYRKSMRPVGEFHVPCGDSHYEVITLAARGYRRHVSVQRLLDHRATARDLLRLAPRRPRPDVICAGLPTLDLAVASARLAEAFECPLVVDVQDLWPDAFAERLPGPLSRAASPLFAAMRRQARRACSAATSMVGVTEPFLQWGLRHAGRARGPLDRAIPLAYRRPVDDDGDDERGLAYWAASGIDFTDPVVAFVGSLSDAFDFEHIVATAREWSTTHPEVRFVVAGTGPADPLVERAAAELPNLVKPGWLDGAELHVLLSHAAVGLAPYRPRPDMVANITNKIIEYMSAGVPIATSLQIGLTADLLAETGTGASYDMEDPVGLGKALESLLGSSSDHAAMSARARAVFDERFDAGRVYADYADHLAAVGLTRRVS